MTMMMSSFPPPSDHPPGRRSRLICRGVATLTVQKASHRDKGVYVCVAENSQGRTESSARVQVKCQRSHGPSGEGGGGLMRADQVPRPQTSPSDPQTSPSDLSQTILRPQTSPQTHTIPQRVPDPVPQTRPQTSPSDQTSDSPSDQSSTSPSDVPRPDLRPDQSSDVSQTSPSDQTSDQSSDQSSDHLFRLIPMRFQLTAVLLVLVSEDTGTV
ncbi:hypothetical protein INR49_022928 [Caranx melampygus]|nr:hypothetical protein INR49_022928 [Caranx melampygus]